MVIDIGVNSELAVRWDVEVTANPDLKGILGPWVEEQERVESGRPEIVWTRRILWPLGLRTTRQAYSLVIYLSGQGFDAGCGLEGIRTRLVGVLKNAKFQTFPLRKQLAVYTYKYFSAAVWTHHTGPAMREAMPLADKTLAKKFLLLEPYWDLF